MFATEVEALNFLAIALANIDLSKIWKIYCLVNWIYIHVSILTDNSESALQCRWPN